MFEDSSEVYIPKIYSNYTTKKVLVMEKICGIKLSNIQKIKESGYDVEKISEIGVKSLFKQVFEYGFFHADPHPGNIFVLEEDRLAYIDFGMIGIIDKKMLNILNEISLALVDKNVDKIIYLLIELNAINSEVDTNSLKSDLLYLIHYYYDVSVEKLTITDILNEVFRFFRKYKVSMPSQLTTLAKTVIILEGTGRNLNSNFSIGSIGKEFLKYYYVSKFSPKRILENSKQNAEEIFMEFRTIPKQMKVILGNLEKNNIKVQIDDIKTHRLESCISDLAAQLSLSLVLASLVVGSSLIITSPNIENNIWIKYMAIAGFLISFIIGLLLVIKILKSSYKKGE
jgi:ubiquinone biosynthesis protein